MKRFHSDGIEANSLYSLWDLLHKIGVNTRPLPRLRYLWDQRANNGGGAEFIIFDWSFHS